MTITENKQAQKSLLRILETLVSVDISLFSSLKNDLDTVGDFLRHPSNAKKETLSQELELIWVALHGYREDCISEDHEEWSDIENAMKMVTENLILFPGPVEGYEDIHKEYPYIDAEYCDTSEVAHVNMLYVPPYLRGRGIGKSVFKEWLNDLPKNVKRIRLKAATLGGSDSLSFWKKLGFTEAFKGRLHDEIENALVLGVNGYANPVVEIIESTSDDRHWTEGKEDLVHFKKFPQTFSSEK